MFPFWEGRAVWKLWLGQCRVLLQCCPGPKGCRRRMDRLSPRWTLVQKVSLDQLKVMILSALFPIYPATDVKSPWLGAHETPACAGLPHTTAHGCQALSDELIWGCLPEIGRVIHLPWHPWCPIYLSPEVQINKKFPCYLQRTMSAWNKLLLQFISQHHVHSHPLSHTSLCVKVPEFWVRGRCGAEVSEAAGREVAWGHTANAHDGFVLPGDLEGSNPFPVLSVYMSQSWANTPGQICRNA